MRGKAQCDSPVLVLLAPPGELLNNQATCTLRRLSNSSREDGRNKKSAKVAISNSFCTVHVPIGDAE